MGKIHTRHWGRERRLNRCLQIFYWEEDTATLYTANPQWIRKLDRLVEQNPEQFEMYRQEKMDGRVISKAYRFPKRFITVRSKDKKSGMTEEQKKEAAERLRQRREGL